MSPRRLFGLLALLEALTWTMLLVGMALKYLTRTTDLGVSVAGPIHGFAFLAYCATVVALSVDARWSASRSVAGLVSGVVPYLTIPFERSTDRAGLLPARWRLRHEAGTGASERLLATGLRAPVRSLTVVVLALLVVFAVLLAIGPPTELVA